MTSALLPPQIVFDNPLTPFGWLYFYVAGTTTPQAAYSDASGSTPIANPLQLDGNGQAVFYLKSGSTYKVNLIDVNLVQQAHWPQDNLVGDPSAAVLAQLASPAAGQGDALVTVVQPWRGAVPLNQGQVNQRFFTSLDFGAIADGTSHPLSSNPPFAGLSTAGWTLAQWQAEFPLITLTSLSNEIDWCAIQSACNYLGSSASGGTVKLYRNTTKGYVIDQPIRLPSFVVLEGSGPAQYPYQSWYDLIANFSNGMQWVVESSTVLTAPNLVANSGYVIAAMGTTTQTQWMAAGAPSGCGPGTYFVATGAAVGTGTVYLGYQTILQTAPATMTYGSGVENLSIGCMGSTIPYGAVRFCGCPGSIADNVSIIGTGIGLLVNWSWNGYYRVHSQTYYYGVIGWNAVSVCTFDIYCDPAAQGPSFLTVPTPYLFQGIVNVGTTGFIGIYNLFTNTHYYRPFGLVLGGDYNIATANANSVKYSGEQWPGGALLLNAKATAFDYFYVESNAPTITASCTTNQLAVTALGSGLAALVVEQTVSFNPLTVANFLGTISGSVLTLTQAATGNFSLNTVLSGNGVTAGTIINTLASGTLGGAGSTYNLSASSTVATAVAMVATFPTVPSGTFVTAVTNGGVAPCVATLSTNPGTIPSSTMTIGGMQFGLVASWSGVNIASSHWYLSGAGVLYDLGNYVQATICMNGIANYAYFGGGPAENDGDSFLMVTGTTAGALVNRPPQPNISFPSDPGAWITPTIYNGWTAAGSPWEAVGYRKNPATGLVELRGLVLSGSLGVDAFILPPGFRPAGKRQFMGSSGTAMGLMIILSTGEVQIISPTVAANGFCFDGIAFQAEQ